MGKPNFYENTELYEAVKAFHKVHCDENSLPLEMLMKLCTHLLNDKEDWPYGCINIATWEQYDHDSIPERHSKAKSAKSVKLE
mmetsp:Transcript_45774/g.69986  ORF Transcript_45774/g.69986 Transcript_45774/m.69986 type:complete len:83 (-) Transcript_45774:9-257(-)